ncbi:hypothetical protein GCM10022232_22600 [Streptomyces plumbiresistens]|uniref:Uncharacterized protein n=1 Tax=Streptomyces plumbiresistens TaxID=511811 RepID=A0ABP7QVH1_9ACTN
MAALAAKGETLATTCASDTRSIASVSVARGTPLPNGSGSGCGRRGREQPVGQHVEAGVGGLVRSASDGGSEAALSEVPSRGRGAGSYLLDDDGVREVSNNGAPAEV